MYLIFALLALCAFAAARTDLSGCTSSNTIAYGGASVLWYVPGTGEICDFLDCGGGRAPPKTTVPGCPLYSGTATYSPSYISGFKDGSAAIASSTSYFAATTTDPSVTLITGTQTMTPTSGSSSLETSNSVASSDLTFITGSASSSSGSTTSSSSAESTKSASSSLVSSSIRTSSSSFTSSGSAASATTSGNASAQNAVNIVTAIIGAVTVAIATLSY